jgi:(p)ppGpp synthase/HD superfamily hydrolase
MDELILSAADYAQIAHHGQTRKYDSKTPYIHHPARVAGRTALLPLATSEMVAAAFLHDVVEDCDRTVTQIEKRFGTAVAKLVYDLTNQFTKAKFPYLNRQDRKAKEMGRLSGVSKEAKQIKMLDRIDNLRELPPDPGLDFPKLYVAESQELLKAIGDGSLELKTELEHEINRLERKLHRRSQLVDTCEVVKNIAIGIDQ